MSAQFARAARCLLSRHRFPAPTTHAAAPTVCSRCGRDAATWPGSWNHRVYRALRSDVATTARHGEATYGPPLVPILLAALVAGVVFGVHQGAWQVPALVAVVVLVVFGVEVLSQPNRRLMAREAAESAEYTRALGARNDRRRALDDIAEARQRSTERARLLGPHPPRTRRAR